MAIIQVPARAIVGKPKLNIANDNNYKNISYIKQDRTEAYTEVASCNLVYCEQSPVSQQKKVGDKDTILYSGYLSEYKIMQENNQIKPTINNPNFTFIGQYQLSDSDDVTPNSYDENLLLKATIEKEQINIEYSQIQFSFKYSANRRNIYIGNSVAVVDSPALMQNVNIVEEITKINRNVVYFNNEQDALNYLLYDYVVAEAPALNRKIIRKSRIYDLVIVDKGNSFDLYFAINAFIKYNVERLDSIRINCDIHIYAKQIVANSQDVNVSAKYSLPDNELLAEQTTYNGTSIYDQISNSIVGEYEKGKFSVDLTCLYMKYNGAIFADTIYTGQDGQMVSVGDIIIPCKVGNPMAYGENVVLSNPALAVNKNNVPYAFKVIKSELNTSDSKYITNNITAVELSGNVTINVDIEPYENQFGLKMFINGKEVDWYTNQKINAKIGDLLEFEYENNSSHEIRIAGAIGFSESTGIHFGKGRRAKFCVYNDGMTITLEY